MSLCCVLYLGLGAMLELLCWDGCEIREEWDSLLLAKTMASGSSAAHSSLTLQNISFPRQTQESGIKESLSWGTQRTQDALYEARAPLERGHSAEIPVGQSGTLVSPSWGSCMREYRECVTYEEHRSWGWLCDVLRSSLLSFRLWMSRCRTRH